MNLKKRLALGVLISTLLAFSVYYAEYLPFTGKWIAAYRMDRYAQEQYPGFHCGKVYFNPCGAPYEAVLRVYLAPVPFWCSRSRRATSVVEPVYRLPSPQRSI